MNELMAFNVKGQHKTKHALRLKNVVSHGIRLMILFKKEEKWSFVLQSQYPQSPFDFILVH